MAIAIKVLVLLLLIVFLVNFFVGVPDLSRTFCPLHPGILKIDYLIDGLELELSFFDSNIISFFGVELYQLLEDVHVFFIIDFL